ncbi:MAG: polysaccharide deacetylase family protein [Phycisphaerales bacterium]|nr:polysaccharide deacetylase family protein [Phycisphaerales bacterium]
MTSVLTKTRFDTWTGRMVRGLRRRYNDHCTTILTYHSVCGQNSVFTAGTSLRHHPREFERQIDYLAEHYNLFSLRELVAMLERGEQPSRAVVLTFDDGYADAIRQAMSILYRRRIPMTIFPVTSVIGNRDLMWQHKLAWLVAEGHTSRVWDGLKAEGWNVNETDDSLVDYVRRCYRPVLLEVLESVVRSVGTSGRALAEEHRPYLESEEIAEADPEFVEFGNHTDTHPVLSALTIGQQMAEITAGHRHITELTGQSPLALAYPFGLKRHYDEDTKRIAANTGHRAVLDMRRRLNTGLVDPFELSRMPAPSGSQVDFEKMVEAWPAAPALEAAHDR